MSAKKVGALIKEARTNAGFTQQGLADKIPGLTASEISKAERGEKELTTEELKAIAKMTGVTQKSLLEAAGKSSSSGKTSSSDASMKLTAAEKKLVELYREADSDTKKKALRILKGESSDTEELISNLFGNALEMMMKK